MPESNIEIISPEDIRTEKMNFKDMIIRCLDRIHILASQTTEKNTRASIQAFEESIATLHSYLGAYYGEAYLQKSESLETQLNDQRGTKDIDRTMLLRKWLSLITRNLSSIGLLPPVDIEFDMTTPEQRDIEEKETLRKIFKKYVKNGKEDIIFEMLEYAKNPPPKIKKPRPKIRDIIDAAYLRDEVDRQ